MLYQCKKVLDMVQCVPHLIVIKGNIWKLDSNNVLNDDESAFIVNPEAIKFHMFLKRVQNRLFTCYIRCGNFSAYANVYLWKREGIFSQISNGQTSIGNISRFTKTFSFKFLSSNDSEHNARMMVFRYFLQNLIFLKFLLKSQIVN